MPRMAFRVTARVPPGYGVTREQVQAYIFDAVTTWKGSLPTGKYEEDEEDGEDPLRKVIFVVGALHRNRNDDQVLVEGMEEGSWTNDADQR